MLDTITAVSDDNYHAHNDVTVVSRNTPTHFNSLQGGITQLLLKHVISLLWNPPASFLSCFFFPFLLSPLPSFFSLFPFLLVPSQYQFLSFPHHLPRTPPTPFPYLFPLPFMDRRSFFFPPFLSFYFLSSSLNLSFFSPRILSLLNATESSANSFANGRS